MSNFKVVEPVPSDVMATTDETTVGIDHPTVVPANFEPAEGERPEPEPADR